MAILPAHVLILFAKPVFHVSILRCSYILYDAMLTGNVA